MNKTLEALVRIVKEVRITTDTNQRNAGTDLRARLFIDEHGQALIDQMTSKAAVPVAVKPLEWSQSNVFGHQKRRGYGVFGEYCSFTVDGLTQEEIADKESEYEAGYKARVRSMIVAPEPTHRHVKRDTEYVLIGYGKMQTDNWQVGPAGSAGTVDVHEVAIYRSVDDGSLWVRPREEFEDGRFEALAVAPEAK